LLANQAPRRFVIYVELKCGRSRKRNEELAGAAVAAVQRHGLQDRAVLISFNLRTVARLKQLDDSLRTGALFGQRRALNSPSKIVRSAVDCAADEILLNHRIASPKLTAAAEAKGFPVVIWTVDDQRWIARAKSLRVYALMTNDPATMLKPAKGL
jgi:glycerophosphoryl diester phosphodiesterase